jgi:hypothetical protein
MVTIEQIIALVGFFVGRPFKRTVNKKGRNLT